MFDMKLSLPKVSLLFKNIKNIDYLVYIAWSLPLLEMIIALFNKFPIIKEITPTFLPLLIVIPLFTSLKSIIHKITFSDILFVIFVFIIMLWNWITTVNPIQIYAQEEYLPRFFLGSFPFYFIGLFINIKRQFDWIALLSLISIIALTFYYNFYKPAEEDTTHSMYAAYLLLPYVLTCFLTFFYKPNALFLIFSIFGTIIILTYGTRGALLNVFIFIITYIILFTNNKQKPLIISILLIIAFLILFFWTDIVWFLYEKLSDAGMSTRIVDFVIEDNFFTDDSVAGRDDFKSVLWKIILDGPFFGYGICGAWPFIEVYPHDLIFDLTITFGLIPGILLFTIFIYIIFQGFKSSSNILEKGFLLILIFTGLIKLFVSYTFLDNPETYLLLGYSINLIRKNRHLKNNGSTIPQIKNNVFKKQNHY